MEGKETAGTAEIGTGYLSRGIAQMEVVTNLAGKFWQESIKRGRFPKSRAASYHYSTINGVDATCSAFVRNKT